MSISSTARCNAHSQSWAHGERGIGHWLDSRPRCAGGNAPRVPTEAIDTGKDIEHPLVGLDCLRAAGETEQ